MVSGGRSLHSKAVRFAAVGILNTIVDMTVFALLVAASAAPLFANLLAWLVAVLFSYALNSRWSFDRASHLSDVRSFGRFFTLGALISLGVSTGAIAVLTDTIGLWPAKILGVILAAILNFLAAQWSIENRLPWSR